MNFLSKVMGFKVPDITKTVLTAMTGGVFDMSTTRVAMGTDPSTYSTKVDGRSDKAVLSPTLLHAVFLCMQQRDGKKDVGGVGKRNYTYVAEMPSGIEDGCTHIATYNATEGTVQACVYDPDAATVSTYGLDDDASNPATGTVVLLVAQPELMLDEEYEECFTELEAMFKAGFPDKNKAYHAAGKLCQNAYYRLKDDSISAHVEIKGPSSGKLPAIKGDAIDKNIYSPDTVYAGEFHVLGTTGATSKGRTKTKKVGFSLENLIGKFNPNPSRVLTPEEELLVPVVGENYIIPELVMDVCDTVKRSARSVFPMMNYTFRGEAGTGKSAACEAIAAGLHRPLVRKTCSVDTEIFDFIGQVMPTSKNKDTEALRLYNEFEKLGGINYANIAKVYDFPSLEDAEFMPEEIYEELTGKTFTESMSETEKLSAVYRAWHKKMAAKLDEVVSLLSMDKENKFVYTETDFIKAIKNGWVVEIQEPNVIASAGVLVGLNGLLEEGCITLPTGEIIQRHPDTVVIFTTNISYQGCRATNQSVFDRSSEVYDVDMPSLDVMVERVMAMTEFPDEEIVREMAQIVSDINKSMSEEGIDDGTCGMRSLLSWAMKTKLTGDPYKSAMTTVIAKCSNDKEARDSLMKRLDESSFKPSRRSRTR